MSNMIRKIGRILTKASKRNHAENVRIAARLPVLLQRLKNKGYKEFAAKARNRVLQEKESSKDFNLSKNGSDLIQIKAENSGLRNLCKLL